VKKLPGRTTRFFLLGAQIDRAIDKPTDRADKLVEARARRRRRARIPFRSPFTGDGSCHGVKVRR